MIKPAAVLLTSALLALSSVAASAHHSHHRHTPPGPTDTHDPAFNPLAFPLCLGWDPVHHRDVWICGRYAY